MRKLLALLLLTLLVVPTLATEETREDVEILTYYLNNADFQFEYNADWQVFEVQPAGSVVVSDSLQTMTEEFQREGQFRMSLFGPSSIRNYPTDPAEAAFALVSDFFPDIVLKEPQSITLNGREATRYNYSDADTAGFVIGMTLEDGQPFVATTTTQLNDMAAQEDALLAVIGSVTLQTLSDAPLTNYDTEPIGRQGVRFSLGLPEGWATQQDGPLVLATNAASVSAFDGTPGTFLLVVSPQLRQNMMLVDASLLEYNRPLGASFDPLTTAIPFTSTGGVNNPPDVDGLPYVVANRWGDEIIALVRVFHAEGEADAARAFALAVRPTIQESLPIGLTLADLPELAFTAGVDPAWSVVEYQGAMIIRPVPPEELRAEDWTMAISFVNAGDPQETFIAFLDQTDYTDANVQTGQAANGTQIFRAATEGVINAPIRWGITTTDGSGMFLITILSFAGNTLEVEAMLEPTLQSLRRR
ncbi:MAG: hypothetical protein AAF125_07310 [Chloroflexota bacterium]